MIFLWIVRAGLFTFGSVVAPESLGNSEVEIPKELKFFICSLEAKALLTMGQEAENQR